MRLFFRMHLLYGFHAIFPGAGIHVSFTVTWLGGKDVCACLSVCMHVYACVCVCLRSSLGILTRSLFYMNIHWEGEKKKHKVVAGSRF